MRRASLLLTSLLSVGTCSAINAADVDYSKQIKPVLQKHCVSCHGEDTQESGLRLDYATLLQKGGDRGPSVVPGKSDESLLYKVLIGKGAAKAMPLDSPRLPSAEIALIKEWIDGGAKIPSDDKPGSGPKRATTHWSFQPIKRATLPNLKATDWPVNGIDFFVLQKLEEAGFKPSKEAERSMLIRRLSLDLLGVLPSPQQVQDFLQDDQPGAYERLVDRTLASPRYGERWGRHWMDIARYADSNGFTIDGPRSIWPFRDWSIRAINEDMPYDQFVSEQLAGDLMPNATREQLVATGFHRNTLINQEGGTDQEQFRNEAVVDRVNTTGTLLLGLSVGCAQCHLHKYDPITQREYYQLFAFFNNCDEPNIPLPSAQQAADSERVKKELADVEKQLKEHDAKRKTGQAQWQKDIAAKPAASWVGLKPTKMVSHAGATIVTDDGERLLLGSNGNVPVNDSYTIVAPTTGKITALRIEALTNPILPNQGPGWTPDGNFVMTEVEISATPLLTRSVSEGGKRQTSRNENDTSKSKPKRLDIAAASTDWAQDGYLIEHTLDGNKKSGWSVGGLKKASVNANREAIYVFKEPIEASELSVVLKFEHSSEKALLGAFRLSVTTDSGEQVLIPTGLQATLSEAAKKPTDATSELIAFAYARTDDSRKPLLEQQTKLKREEADLKAAIPTTMVLQERSKNPRQSYIHVRGDWLNKGANVDPGTPASLPPINVPEGKTPNRVDLCNWFFSPEHPLTSRVTVNRYWQAFFGIGIVETENDFGTQGNAPTHPELLDWLASELIREQWSQKALHRLIVTSATYRQSSGVTSEHLQRDPYNRLLGRQRRVRLEAEAIRDSALAASGVLSQKMHGPGVYPPQPKGIYVVTQVAKAWPESQGDDRYRRGLYTYFWRSSPYPLLPTFDAPDANGSCTRRNRSNTPLQALTLANDGSFMELARAFSDRIVSEASASDETRIALAFRAALSRDPSPQEREKLLSFVDQQRRRYAADAEVAKQAASPTRPAGIDDVTSATWTAFSRVLLNLDEFITRE